MGNLIWVALVLFLVYGVIKLIPGVFAMLGNNAFANGDVEKAMEFHKKAADRGKPENKITYALLLMRTGNFREAEGILNSIILYGGVKSNVKYTAKAYRCMIYEKTDRLDEAIEDAEEIFESFKNTATYGIVGYLRQCKGDAALEFCKEAYEYNSDDRDICDNLAVAYLRTGDLDKAEEITAKLREDFPQFVEGFYHSAITALKKGDKKAAAECLESIDDCKRTAMTTVSEEEIEKLREEINNA